jgi:hypothetical protein
VSIKTIEVRLTRDRRNEPLVIVDSALGNGMEASPAHLRALAAALCRVADDAEAQQTKARHFVPARREYDLLESE